MDAEYYDINLFTLKVFGLGCSDSTYDGNVQLFGHSRSSSTK